MDSDETISDTSDDSIEVESKPEGIKAILDDKFYLIKKIGEGSTSKIYLGYSPMDRNKTLFSFKVVDLSFSELSHVQNEANVLSSLNSDFVIKIYFSSKGILRKVNKTKNVFYMALEYLENGDISDYIPKGWGFGEELTKILSIPLIQGISSLHEMGIVHRDIKLENIMLSSKFEIKLADLGLALKQINPKLTTFSGTPGFCSPQIVCNLPYHGMANDVFSLGVTLFWIMTGDFPFKPNQGGEENLYRHIMRGDYGTFWNSIPFKGISEEFKELFNSMVAFDEGQRPSISEIKMCRWLRNLREEFYKYYPVLMQNLRKRKEALKPFLEKKNMVKHKYMKDYKKKEILKKNNIK